MNERILIVDDEETLCYFLKESLEEKGYQVVTTHTAGEGLKVAARQQTDLVLLDLKLPDGNGLDVLGEIRKTDSDLPVIVLTGHAAVESAVQAMKLGAYDYLEKPINLAQLTAGVAAALESRRERSAAVQSRADVPGAGSVVTERTESAEVIAGRDDGWGQQAEFSRIHRHLERRIEEVEALDSISASMMRSLKLDDVIQNTVEGLVQSSSIDMAAVFLGDETGRELVLAHQRRFPPHVWDDPELRRVEGEGVLGKSRGGSDGPLALRDAGPDSWVEKLSGRLGGDVVTLLVPMRDVDKLRGLMLIGRRGRQPFDGLQTRTLCCVAERLARVVAHAAEMSWLKERVAALMGHEALHQGVLEGMINGLVVVDRQAKVRLVNRAGESMLGCIEEEVLDRSIDEVLGPGAAMVRGSLERELAYSGEEIAIRRDGGESVPLGMSVSPLRGDGGKVSGAVVMLRDLREAKALEEERRRLDRLALLGEISAVMAHEIRNPLAGMAAGIQHMLTKFEEGDEKHQALERIQREGERVNRIIEDILLISRPPHLNLAPCDISEVVEEVVRQHEESARGQGIEIRKYYASELPPVKGDRLRLHQALSNLLKEVIAAMPSGGELGIAVTGPGRVESVGRGDGECVEVEIWNNLVAIKEEEIRRVFDPFYTTKARGTGLGLAITRRIINEHGGEIEVESKEGEGTRFIVRLPLARRGGR